MEYSTQEKIRYSFMISLREALWVYKDMYIRKSNWSNPALNHFTFNLPISSPSGPHETLNTFQDRSIQCSRARQEPCLSFGILSFRFRFSFRGVWWNKMERREKERERECSESTENVGNGRSRGSCRTVKREQPKRTTLDCRLARGKQILERTPPTRSNPIYRSAITHAVSDLAPSTSGISTRTRTREDERE